MDVAIRTVMSQKINRSGLGYFTGGHAPLGIFHKGGRLTPFYILAARAYEQCENNEFQCRLLSIPLAQVKHKVLNALAPVKPDKVLSVLNITLYTVDDAHLSMACMGALLRYYPIDALQDLFVRPMLK
jgi:hypothetical protein